MHSQMQKAEDYAKDLAKYYIAASRHLQSEQNAILRRFALTHHMTVKEAEELISSLKEPDIKELIKALKKDPKNAELVKEFEAHSARARIMRLNSLQSQVTYTAGQIQVLLNKKAQKLFVNLARSAYYNTMFDAMQRAGYGFNVKMLDPKRIKRVMDRSWTGAGFSKRLWSNTKALEDAVKREIMVNLLTGRPLIKASQAINDEFGKGYNNARRLIRTESAYITNQMTLEGYKDLDADKYIYVAVLDLKTSEVCRGLDKKRFLVSSAKVGVNYPPMHPWCRSTTIPWMPDHLLKNMKQRALDPKTGKHVLVPGDMTYEQWYKQFVQGQPAGDSTTQTIAAQPGMFTNNNVSVNTTLPNSPSTDTSSLPIKANYIDITKELKENAEKNPESVYDTHSYTDPEGNTYIEDGSSVLLDYDKDGDEYLHAGLLSRALGEDVKMCPRVTGTIKYVHTPDYLVGANNARWDQKGLNGSGGNALRSRITGKKGKGRKQAENYYVNIKNWKGKDEDEQNIYWQAKKIFEWDNTDFVQQLILYKDNEIIMALKRA